MNAKDGRDCEDSSAMPEAWWSLQAGELTGLLGVDPQHGLNTEQVEQNRLKYGSNVLQDIGPSSLIKLFWERIKSPMMVLLLSIAGISLAFGQVREAVVMAIVVSMYAGIHLLNRARSDHTMARLRELQVPTLTVLREGQRQEIPVDDVVVGDILLLKSRTLEPPYLRPGCWAILSWH